MRQLGRAGSAALLLLALGSCQPPPYPLDLVAQDGKLLFWTKVERRWFVWPHRPDEEELCSLDVWAGREWIWRVKLIPCRKGALPIPFGASGPGLRTLVPAKALQSGVTYVARAGADWEGWMEFRLDAGRKLRTAEAHYVQDPDETAFAERRDRRIAELQAGGLPIEEAVEIWRNEMNRAPAVPLSKGPVVR
ncbi:hypothetical protein [Sphingomonas sp. LHG3406-1]|uniref:hypothetical protein n=1 Tax=Sphingomonas sp. LHG3406-1 TaxID=2804617 RepID=UPI00262C4D8D|nr:hypothetical protein [Sphingomonas sp. LHG3406-1]